jgi:hypothetical protein
MCYNNKNVGQLCAFDTQKPRKDARYKADAAVANESPNIYPQTRFATYPLFSNIEPLGRLHGEAALTQLFATSNF